VDLMNAVSELSAFDDVLDAEAINRIEELHSATVVWAQSEHRFGIWGKRASSTSEAEAAEQAYLAERGFASYNDFRLRIRRSTVTSALPIPPGPPRRGGQPMTDHTEDLEDLPAPLGASACGDGVGSAARDDEDAAGEQLRRRIAPLVAAFQADADRLMILRTEQVELQTAQILSRASEESAEILRRSTAEYDAVVALVEEALRRFEHLVALTDGLPAMIGGARDEAASIRRALGELTAPSAPTAD
jgi:hypothetical protein